MSPKITPGTATVSVPVAWSAMDAVLSVQVTAKVSLKIPLNWSLPLREVIAVAAAIF
jgi:hypothetical protein